MQVTCPLCQLPLTNSERRWHCSNQHSFDIAKQGYCNLLAVQHKKSRAPGDNATMVEARHRFLSSGFYQSISQGVCQLARDVISSQSPGNTNKNIKTNIIDAGCGEGYYSCELFEQLNQHNIHTDMMGIDIAKPAVLHAAKRNKAIRWFVANSSRIPVANHSADIILSLFSPIPAAEFHRCLKPNGTLILATTGEQHLIELRERLYDTVKTDTFQPQADLLERFTATQSTTITETIHLTNNQQVQDLFAMTPHYWRVSPERKTVLDSLAPLDLSLDVKLHLYTAKH